MIGLHIQKPVNDWTRTLTRFPNGTWIKAVDNVQALDEAKRIHPGLKTVLRHWYDGGQIFGTTDQATLRIRAREFFRTFVDGTFDNFAHNVDAIEEWNEYNASSHTGQDLAERVAWADAVSWVWTNEYRALAKYAHIRLVLGNTAIGNDIPWQYAQFAHERDCIIGYHPYVPVRYNEVMPHEWEFYSGRWTVMDAAWKERGYHVQWLFTEFGPVGYTPPASLNALDGWRHFTVNGAVTDEYLKVIEYWLDKTTAWNQQNGSRALGAVLFTTGGGAQWQWFETKQPEIDAITEFMEGYEVVPPIEPPPTVEPRVYSRTVHLLPQSATREQARAVLDVAFDNKQSVVWSADDAVMNPDPKQAELTARNVTVWGAVPGGELIAWEQWQAAHYPPALTEMVYRDFAELEDFRFTHWPTEFRTGGLLGDGINQLFGARPEYYGQFCDDNGLCLQGHDGIDFHTTTGSPIYAVADGTVYRLHTDPNSHNWGIHVRVEHIDGYKTIYAHLSAINVTEGQHIKAGDVIGFGGSTGNSGGPHLHLALKKTGSTAAGSGWPWDIIDPTPFMEQL